MFGFTRKILHDFQGLSFFFLVSECVSFPRKINNPFCGVTVFLKKSDIFFIGRETKHTFYRRKINEKKIAKVSPSNNNYSFTIIQCVALIGAVFFQKMAVTVALNGAVSLPVRRLVASNSACTHFL